MHSVPLPLIALIALPPPATALPLLLAELPALLATVPTVVPVAPNLRWRMPVGHMDMGHINHTRRRWRGVNHSGRGINHTGRGVIDRAGHAHMAINRGMADA